MATDSSKVRVAVTGEVLMGATAAAAPTGTGGTTVGFTGLGFVSEDGVTETRDRSSDDIKAWQNAATVRTVITDATLTYSFTLIETKKETVELYYGSTVTAATTDGSLVVIRTYIPQGEVTEVGDKVYASGEPIGYEVTITAYPDTTLGGSAKIWATALKS